jgi:hypothetical protein
VLIAIPIISGTILLAYRHMRREAELDSPSNS